MASPMLDTRITIPPELSANALATALTALQEAPPTPTSSPPPCETNALFRNYFTHICSNPDIYDSIRDLISETSYWATEEAHFEVICDIVRDYNGSVQDLKFPPLEWLRKVWRRRERNLQAVLKSTSLPPSSLFLLLNTADTPPSTCSFTTSTSANKRRLLRPSATKQPVTRSRGLSDIPPSARTRSKTQAKVQKPVRAKVHAARRR